MLKKFQANTTLEKLINKNREDLLKDKAEMDRIERRIDEKHSNDK